MLLLANPGVVTEPGPHERVSEACFARWVDGGPVECGAPSGDSGE